MFASRTNWSLEPSPLARAIAEKRDRREPLLDLIASNPTTCGFEYPANDILAALADHRALEYTPESKGRLEARQAVAEYYRGRPAFGAVPDDPGATIVDPERIVLTAGTSEAYTYIFRLLCEPGDEILIPAPSYPLFTFLADLADIRLIPYPLLYDHGWQIDLHSLRKAHSPRSRAVLLVHPNNPTGSYVKQREAAELAAVCADRGMAIVADEVFLDYAAPSQPPRETFALHDKVLTFTLSGLSKISALPQMKLAWIVVSGPGAAARRATERLDVIADTYLSAGTPVQLALPAFLKVGPRLRSQIDSRISTNLKCLDAALSGPGSVSRLEREGGWYAVLRVPATSPDEMLAVRLVEHESVLTHPGSFYNFASEGFLVVSLISKIDDFAEGIGRIRGYFEG